MRKWSLQKNKIPTNLKRIFLSLMLSNFFYHSFCQSLPVNEISLSQTWIYNKTTIYDIYSGARARNKTGTAISNGVNLNYSRTIYKNFYAKIGFGYFKQKFGIHRGFDFKESGTALFYTTKYYAYHTFNYFGGIGYSKSLSKDHGKILPKSSGFRFLAVYNFFNTYKQEFKHTYNSVGGSINPKIRKDNYSFGRSLTLQAGVNRPLYKDLRIGLDILFPAYNRWRKDKIFKENMNEFHGSDFSIGTSVNLIYQIKTKK